MNFNHELLRTGLVEDFRFRLPTHRTKRWKRRDPYALRGMVLHQSLEDIGEADGVAQYHVGPNHISKTGLPGMSYTMFIEKSGRIALANDIEDKTYSQGYLDPDWVDENAAYIGVCVGGNFSGPGYVGSQKPTAEQLISVHRLWTLCKSIWGWNGANLFGHYHLGKPACPGNELMEYIDSQRPLSFATAVEKQKALTKTGHYRGRLDGIWGPKSKAALVEFQRVMGLSPDGVWGQMTSEAMQGRLEALA